MALLEYVQTALRRSAVLARMSKSMTASSVGGSTIGQWVFGCVEREPGRAYFTIVHLLVYYTNIFKRALNLD